MEELIARVSQAAGIETDLAQKSVGMILNFLSKEAPAEHVADLMNALPGAQAAADAVAPAGGGMLGALGGMMGASGGGLMALAGQLSGAGLGMGEMTAVGKELFAAAREKIGEDKMGEIVASVPGLHQFV